MGITRWYPDTCKCILEYTMGEDGEPIFHDAKRICVTHEHLAADLLLAAVLQMNRAKNLA